MKVTTLQQLRELPKASALTIVTVEELPELATIRATSGQSWHRIRDIA